MCSPVLGGRLEQCASDPLTGNILRWVSCKELYCFAILIFLFVHSCYMVQLFQFPFKWNLAKVKVVSLYSTSSCTMYTPNALFITNQSRRSHTQAGAPAGQTAQSAVQRSAPSVTHIMGYYSFNRPRRDGRLSWPCWLTDSGHRTRKVVKQPCISLAQDKESPLARTDILTTMLRHQMANES